MIVVGELVMARPILGFKFPALTLAGGFVAVAGAVLAGDAGHHGVGRRRRRPRRRLRHRLLLRPALRQGRRG